MSQCSHFWAVNCHFHIRQRERLCAHANSVIALSLLKGRLAQEDVQAARHHFRTVWTGPKFIISSQSCSYFSWQRRLSLWSDAAVRLEVTGQLIQVPVLALVCGQVSGCFERSTFEKQFAIHNRE